MNDIPGYGAAAASGAGAVGAWAWLAQANQIAAFVASLVAIIAGLYAIRHYRRTHKRQ